MEIQNSSYLKMDVLKGINLSNVYAKYTFFMEVYDFMEQN